MRRWSGWLVVRVHSVVLRLKADVQESRYVVTAVISAQLRVFIRVLDENLATLPNRCR